MDSVDWAVCTASVAVEGEENVFPSALIAALLARNPLELFKMEENLFLTCFKGLSRPNREGDLGV